uniref:MFS domain-containing protein n=1 Tax=Macrostomum lignano TaxID=282301 RepID=A0A1I8FJ43_9PLAT
MIPTRAGSHMGTVIGLPLSGYLCSNRFPWRLASSVLHVWCIRHRMVHRLEHSGAQLASRQSLDQPGGADATFKRASKAPGVGARGGQPADRDGLVSALPYLVLWATSNLTALLADATRSRGWLGVTAIRKLSIALGAVGGAAGIALVGHLGCPPRRPGHRRADRPRVACPASSSAASGRTTAGPGAALRRHLCTALATPGNRAGMVFYLSAGIVLAAALGYLAFAAAHQVQPWASQLRG